MGEIHERPILFSGKMIQAILAGHKTQTRRIVKHCREFPRSEQWPFCYPAKDGMPVFLLGDNPELAARYKHGKRCPYGATGDRLWVRETWAPHADEEETFRNYARSMSGRGGPDEPGIVRPQIFYRADGGDPFVTRWRPSIHMPRWASRITLEVTGIRIERLREIREKDAIAEGFGEERGVVGQQVRPGPRDRFADLWDKINGKRATWESNPWVWVVSFRRVTP